MSKEVKLVCIATPPRKFQNKSVEVEYFTITEDDWQEDEPEEGETFDEYVDYSIGEIISEWEQRFYSAVVMTEEQFIQAGLSK